MDFYTLNTTVDLHDAANLAHVHRSIGFFVQPMLMGEPREDKKGEFLRFAVPCETLCLKEDAFMEMLCFDSPFTAKNTTLVRSEHI